MNAEATGLVISHWLSTRYAVDFLDIWERINNPDFNNTIRILCQVRRSSGLRSFFLFRQIRFAVLVSSVVRL